MKIIKNKEEKKERIIKLQDYLVNITDYHANGSYEVLNKNVELLNEKNYAIMIRTVDFEKNFKNDNIYISKSAYNYLKKSYLEKDDIIMNKIACPGKTYIVPELGQPATLGMNLFKLITNDNVINKFLYYYLKQNEWYIYLFSNGSVTKTITKEAVRKLKIHDFNKKEQEKIAQVLSQQEEQVNNIQKLIEKLEKRNQYYAERLLSGELRVREDEDGNIEFYENEDWKEVTINGKIINIPHSWEIEYIGSKNLKIIGSGINKFSGSKKYYATGEVGYFNDYDDNPTSYITYLDRTSRANMQPLNNSIWFARMQFTNKFLSFKNSKLINSLILSTGMAGIEVLNDFDFDFVKNFIMSQYFINNKDRRCEGATQKAINNKNLQLINIFKPELYEQILISKILDSIKEEKHKMQKLLEKEQKRFEWLSDALLSGEYQIVD